MGEHRVGTASCWLLNDTGRVLVAQPNRGQCGLWERRDHR